MRSISFIIIAFHIAATAMAVQAVSSQGSEKDGDAFSESVMEASVVASDQTAVSRHSAHLGLSNKSFLSLAPRQKVMGLVNAIALLRTKISLMEEMSRAFEPQAGKMTPPPPYGHMLPGPALAYGDCRLGILGFDVCRHLGFLESDPMVAPSSTQSKMLRLVGASSLVTSFKTGQLHLQEDADLNSVLGPSVLETASRALSACWNAQLLYPAFDARPVNAEQMREAMMYADKFLINIAVDAKKILRFSRSEYADVGSWLASIFSDFPISDTSVIESNESTERVARESSSLRTADGMDSKPARSHDEATNERRIFSGLLNRLFPPSQQRSQSQSASEFAPPAPTGVFSALANSVGGITSIVSGTAQNAVKAISGEPPADNTEETTVVEETEKRLGDILDMIPEELNGQF